MTKVIALIGNPNSGKTTLFNNLTGAHQKVGNWSGVTVEKKSGPIELVGEKGELVDLPGIYSLEQEYQGLDEKIARTFLEEERVDLIINILDTSNLQRNLVLTEQLIELNIPMVVVLNMQDVAEKQGIIVDAEELESRLGIPVVSTIASLKKGMNHLKLHLLQQVDPQHQQLMKNKKAHLEDQAASEKILHRYEQVNKLTKGVVENHHQVPVTEKIDRWVLNRFLGIPIFLLSMYILFTVAINAGAIFIDFFDILTSAIFVDGTRWLLQQVHSPELLTTLIADGIGGGDYPCRNVYSGD